MDEKTKKNEEIKKEPKVLVHIRFYKNAKEVKVIEKAIDYKDKNKIEHELKEKYKGFVIVIN